MNNQSQPSFTQHPSADPTEGTGIKGIKGVTVTVKVIITSNM
jgi:hypothetical protein